MRPFVFVNVAVTADGKIDTWEHKGATISSALDKTRVDRLRAGADAIMVGGRTLLDEDPKLTVKSEALRAERQKRGLSPNPMKVGVVSQATIRLDSAFLNTGPAPIVIFTTWRTPTDQIERLREHGVQVFVHSAPRVDLNQALQTLYDLGVRRLMVEGGGTLNFELLRLGLVDEWNIYIAPMIFGGVSAPTPAMGAGLSRQQALPLRLVNTQVHPDGGVVLTYSLLSEPP